MKRYDKVTRYSIKKYSVGVASVAVAAFVFFAGGEAQAADTNAEIPVATENSQNSTEEKAATEVEKTEEKTAVTPNGSEETSKAEEKEGTATPKSEEKDATVENETSVENKEATTVEGSETPTSEPTNSTENKEKVSTLEAENDETTEDNATASNEETPTLANVSEKTNSNLIKGAEFNGEYGVNVSFKGKDGKEYTTTYGGASFANLEKIDTTSPITATFTLKNGDKDINANIILVVPNYWAGGNSSLVFDDSNIDKEKGISINSSLGNDYSSLLRYGNTNGEYKTLQEYKNLYGDAIFNEQLRAVRLEGGQIKANDIVTFTLNMKLKEQDAKDTPSQSVTFSIYNFINGHNGYETDNLNITLIHDEDINTGILLDKQVLPTYRPINGQDGGVLWEYAEDIQQYMPTPDKMFRYGRVDNTTLPEDKLVSEKTEDGYYIAASGDERLKGFPNLSNYTYLLIDEAQKNISTHGYTANPEGIQYGFYRYAPERSEDFVLNGVNLDAQEEAGAKILHFQVIPSIILKEDQTYIVGKTNETTWDPKTMVKQFTDPNVIKWLVAENDSNQLDKSKLTVKITDISDENAPKDVSSLSLQKAGKYKVEYSHVFKDSTGTGLPISNTGYVTVLTGKQKLIVNVVDKNDPAKEVILSTETIEGTSGAAVDTAALNNKKEQLAADYVAKGYKFVSNTALPTNFDNTENFVDNVDEVPQVVEIAFVHDTEEKKEYSDAERVITYVGAGESTPQQLVEQVPDVFVKTSTIDKVTKEVIGTPTISGSHTFKAVEVPEIKGYTADKKEAGAGIATFENPKVEETVTYTKNPDIKIPDSKDVIRTITITLPDGTTNKVEQKVTFTRTNTQDPVTDVVTNGEWNVEKQTLPAYIPTDYQGFTTKVNGSVAEIEVTPDTDDLTTTINYVNTPLVKNEDISFETKYLEDETLDFGKTAEAVQGQVGTKKVTTTYKFENGNSVEQNPVEEVVVAPVDRVIKVGTKPKVETSEVAYKTVYEADDTLEYGQTKVKTEGVNGVDTTTTTYKLAGDHAVANEPTTARTTEPTNKVILVGTKSSVVTKELDYKTIYKENTSLEAGEQKVIVEGKKGSEVTTTTYEVNTMTGDVTPFADTKATAAVDEVIEVGTKEKVETESKNIPLRYEADNTLEKGQQVVEKEGKAGQKVTTITYKLNEQTGEVSENDPVIVETPSEERVIKVGTKPTSVITKQDYKTIYEADNTLAYGQRKVKQSGEMGVTTIVTTYTVDEKTGQLTSHEQAPQVFAPQEEIILVGTQPTIETKDVDFEIEYVADPSLSFGGQVVVEGEKGELTTTTTYKLDTTTGEVTVDKTTEAQTKAPKNKVVKVGTQPKVEMSEVAYQTIYEADDTLEAGQRKVKTEGVNGVDTTTTTYKLEGDHAVVDKTTTVRTTELTDKVILVGTKPSVATEELAYKTIYKNSSDLELGETKVKKQGVNGVETTTTSYSLNTTTGEVTQSTKVETSEPVDEIILVGTKLKEEKHTYSYNFVSTTRENLPKEVLDLAPNGGEYDATQALVPELPAKLQVETEKGTWTFVGYTPSEVLDFEDVVFVGEWNFVKKAEPITPPRPNKPEKPVTPPRPEKPEKPEDPILPQPNEDKKPSEPQKPQNPQEPKQETPKQNPQKENKETSTQKEVKKLPKTTATNNTLGASALMLTVLAALGLKRRKDNK